jgi:hypothetical protein
VKKGVFQLIILSLLGIEMIFFLHTYFIHESWSTAGIRSDGNRQAVEYIAQNKGKYDHVYMMATGWFPAYYLYFTHDFDKKYAGTFRPNLKIDGVGDVKFIDSDCPRSDFFTVDQQNVLSSQAKILILVNSVCKLPFISYFNKIGTINAAGNQTVYDIYRFDSHTFSN